METRKWVCKNNIFGCNWMLNFFQRFNDGPNFSSKYGCWIGQYHGNYGVWWKYCSTSHRTPIPWSVGISMKGSWYIDASVRSFFRWIRSSTIFGVVKQNMKVFPKCWMPLKSTWYVDQKYNWHMALYQTTSYICYETPRHV